jgi:hypothetical protein
VLKLQSRDVALKRCDSLFQFRTLMLRCGLVLGFRGCWNLWPE